jgi:methylenetetrahydrofolate dehydrogenase (NADP+)/methenyltetrahydrofolate cyclohydrolase
LAQKEKVAKKLGIEFRLHKFAADITSDALREEVKAIAADDACGGVIVQLPLPNHIDQFAVLDSIPREKDVDVLSESSLGAFYADRSKVLPPAVGVVEAIIADQKISLATSSVATVGLGLLVGRPTANWMMRRAKQTLLLRSTSDLGLVKDVDIVILGAGRAGHIKSEMLKANATVIDFGYDGGKGDFDAIDSASQNYTPTPGGTGPILVAKLFENFYRLNSKE